MVLAFSFQRYPPSFINKFNTYKLGVLHWTPKRRVGHQQFTSDDDDMILEYARKKGGVIVTRDQYRDSYDRCPEFKEVIEKRYILSYQYYNYIEDIIMRKYKYSYI